jgi:hypothetical protein
MAPAKKPPKTATATPPTTEPPKIYRSLGQIRRAFYPQGEKGAERENSGKHTRMVGFPAKDTPPEERGRLQA